MIKRILVMLALGATLVACTPTKTTPVETVTPASMAPSDAPSMAPSDAAPSESPAESPSEAPAAS